MSAANNPALFRITEIAPPVHLLSATGIGQEHFEAMSVEQPNVFITPAGPSAAPSGVGLDRSPAGYDAIPQAKSQAEMKLLENNTTNLPNAIAQGDLPISGSQPQIPVDVNAARRPSGADAASPAQISGQRRLLEMNTTMLAQDDPVYPYAEAVTPHIGRPR
jgi:hypothetical protein